MYRFSNFFLIVFLNLSSNIWSSEEFTKDAAVKIQNQKLRDQLIDDTFKCRLCDVSFKHCATLRRCLDHYNASVLVASAVPHKSIKKDHVELLKGLRLDKNYSLSFDNYDKYIIGHRVHQSKVARERGGSATASAASGLASSSSKDLRDKLFTSEGHCRLCGERVSASIIRACLTHYGFSTLVPGEVSLRTGKKDHVEYIAAIKASGLHTEILENHERYVLNQRGSSAAHKARKKALQEIVKQTVLSEANKRQRTASPELHE